MRRAGLLTPAFYFRLHLVAGCKGVSFLEFYIALQLPRCIKMSWAAYITSMKSSNTLSEACIAGLDGNVWAKSDGINVSLPHCLRIGTMAELPTE